MCFDFDKDLNNFMQFERTLIINHHWVTSLLFLVQIFFTYCQDYGITSNIHNPFKL